jgi:hypothetical protein
MIQPLGHFSDRQPLSWSAIDAWNKLQAAGALIAYCELQVPHRYLD